MRRVTKRRGGYINIRLNCESKKFMRQRRILYVNRRFNTARRHKKYKHLCS